MRGGNDLVRSNSEMGPERNLAMLDRGIMSGRGSVGGGQMPQQRDMMSGSGNGIGRDYMRSNSDMMGMSGGRDRGMDMMSGVGGRDRMDMMGGGGGRDRMDMMGGGRGGMMDMPSGRILCRDLKGYDMDDKLMNILMGPHC